MGRGTAISTAFALLLLTATAISENTQQVIDKEQYYSGRTTTPPIAQSDSIYDPPLTWPTFYGAQQTGTINTLFGANGNFGEGFVGYGQLYDWPYVGFETPAYSGQDYLWGGGVWVGGIVEGDLGTDTLVSTGFDGWIQQLEFAPASYGESYGSVTKYDYPTDFSMRAEFTDTIEAGVIGDFSGRPYTPLNLHIANRSHVWRTDPYQDFVLYDMVITNIGDDPISRGFVGIYIDGDVVLGDDSEGWVDDLSGAISAEGIAYIIDNDGEPTGGVYAEETSLPKAIAVKFLDTSFEPSIPGFNWWASSGISKYDFGPRRKPTAERPYREFCDGATGTPVCDADKYYMMSTGEWDYNQVMTAGIIELDTMWQLPPALLAEDLTNGYDARFCISIGPFDLLPDSSVRVLYTMFTADSIHTDPNNMDFLPHYGGAYTEGLNLERLLPVVDAALEKVDEILDPTLPVTGLDLVSLADDTALLQWDPWVYDVVEGYELYLTEVDMATFPHAGTVPPWLTGSSPTHYASFGRARQIEISGVDFTQVHLAQVANRTGSETGQLSEPLIVHSLQRPLPPGIPAYTFVPKGEQMFLEWDSPAGVAVSHYNVYTFPSMSQMQNTYHAFYDRQLYTEEYNLKDSVEVDSDTWYYYAMEPYTQIDGGTTQLTDWAEEGNVYIIVAVDADGFESEFTAVTEVLSVEPMTRDVMVITNTSPFDEAKTPNDTIIDFYNTVLSGLELDYRVFDSYNDCGLQRPDSCPSWDDLCQYRLIIIDDGLSGQIVPEWFDHLERYLQYGGKLACFGPSGFAQPIIQGSILYSPVPISHDQFLYDYFAVDSSKLVSLNWYLINGPLPDLDTLFGFVNAESIAPLFPLVAVDTLALVSRFDWGFSFPFDTPPEVAVFKVREGGLGTHMYRSRYPTTSAMEGEIVGLKTVTRDTFGRHETFLYGFHLYYMDVDNARDLIASMMTPLNTFEGRNVELALDDQVIVTFDSVAASGTTFITIGDEGPEMPGNILPVPEHTLSYCNIATNAIIEGDITVCVGYDDFGMELEDEVRVRLMHYDDDSATWSDITKPGNANNPDTDVNRVEGFTESLSTFTVGKYENCCGVFNEGSRGNIDCSINGKITMFDIRRLITYVYVDMKPLCCPENANTDADTEGKINLLDIVRLIDHVYISKAPTPPCPE